MIANEEKKAHTNDPVAVVGLLIKSDLNFYLTGSRFFGNVTATSDYDYFVKDCPEVEEFLKANKFKAEGESYPSLVTTNCSRVFRRGIVHVQLVENPELKNKIQNILRESNFMGEFLVLVERSHHVFNRKTFMKHFWDTVCLIAELGKEEPSSISDDLEESAQVSEEAVDFGDTVDSIEHPNLA